LLEARALVTLKTMNLLRNLFVSMGATALAVCVLTGVGCASGSPKVTEKGPPTAPEAIRPSEQLTIEFFDINPPQTIQQTVQEDGSITLGLGQRFVAAGKTVVQLQKEIHDAYVPKYYRRLSVNIKRENRFFFVGGQVRNPSQRAYTGDMTIIRAIKAAGDFTEYADKRRVKIIRNSGVIEMEDVIEALKDPKLDLPVYPGDQIDVPLSKF